MILERTSLTVAVLYPIKADVKTLSDGWYVYRKPLHSEQTKYRRTDAHVRSEEPTRGLDGERCCGVIT
jgi:hypothetical protein